ncbi:MAG: hypothetical protein K9M80_05260 [Candidatus Marinimicrobia bacterium]|nr:hypothetical protein [Candidatus Neomarinimicrobiota bacterium]
MEDKALKINQDQDMSKEELIKAFQDSIAYFERLEGTPYYQAKGKNFVCFYYDHNVKNDTPKQKVDGMEAVKKFNRDIRSSEAAILTKL